MHYVILTVYLMLASIFSLTVCQNFMVLFTNISLLQVVKYLHVPYLTIFTQSIKAYCNLLQFWSFSKIKVYLGLRRVLMENSEAPG